MNKHLSHDLVVRRWLEPDPGHPLGRGYPPGSPLRNDGESHLEAWKRLLRADPCAYCGLPMSGTVDHIEPRAAATKGNNRWVNLTGACFTCNNRKGHKKLLLFLAESRVPKRPRPRTFQRPNKKAWRHERREKVKRWKQEVYARPRWHPDPAVRLAGGVSDKR